jgi:hypothetical protein
LKRSSQKLGEKRFRALQTDKDAPLNAAQGGVHAPRELPGGATETNMTICTSSSIRTVTVGSGFSPDLLTPCRHIDDAGARGLTGRRFRVAGIPPVGNFTPP